MCTALTLPSSSYPSSDWLMLLVRPVWISCLWRSTAMRARPRPLSSMGRPSEPWVSTAVRVDLPLSVLPATAREEEVAVVRAVMWWRCWALVGAESLELVRV